jgi:transcriptional regulator with XRE-family HTH domain
MTNSKEVILKLKEVRKEKGYSLDVIRELIEQNNQFVSKSTLSRVFSEGSEEKGFRYEETLRPIANALLDIETIELDDDVDTQAYKSILKLKKDLIADYEAQNRELKEALDKEKIKHHEKIDKERAQFQRSLDFLKNQIELKDQRIDALLTTTTELMSINNQLLKQLMECPLKHKENC